MTKLSGRIKRETRTVEIMIRRYCKDHHAGKEKLCDACRQLLDYARTRLARCPFQEQKTTCGKCAIHCYQPKMQKKIRTIMRTVGPRMLLTNPYLGIMHLIDGLRSHNIRRPPGPP